MTTGRLEAFTDAVIAIVITILVLELKVPHEPGLEALREIVPVFLTYVLSFVYLGIYWNNHHHMMVLTERVNGKILWANLHLLFWLSLVPFTTAWMGENDFAEVPTAFYGADLLLAAIAYFILQTAIIAEEGPDSRLRAALGRDLKGTGRYLRLSAEGDPARIRQSLDRAGCLRLRRVDVARARPPHRIRRERVTARAGTPRSSRTGRP